VKRTIAFQLLIASCCRLLACTGQLVCEGATSASPSLASPFFFAFAPVSRLAYFLAFAFLALRLTLAFAFLAFARFFLTAMFNPSF
jgi:hypothetical protein